MQLKHMQIGALKKIRAMHAYSVRGSWSIRTRPEDTLHRGLHCTLSEHHYTNLSGHVQSRSDRT